MKMALIFPVFLLFTTPAFAGDNCHGPIRYEDPGTTIKIWLEGQNQEEYLTYQIGQEPRKTFSIIEIIDLGDPGESIRIFIGERGLRLVVNFRDGFSPPDVITGSIWIPEFNVNPNHDSKNPIALACEGVPF